MTFDELLHPTVKAAALAQFGNGHHREAVVNAVTAAFDMIRARTGLDLDGADLVNSALSEQRPFLIMGDLDTESGRNVQVGALQLARGLYQAFRNPGSHSTATEWNALQAARVLVVASLLAQLVADSRQGDFVRLDGVYAAAQDGFSTRFIRFFRDNKAVSVSVSRTAEDWVPDWLTLDWADWQRYPVSSYQLVGNRIAFTVELEDGGEIRYEGQVQGRMLRLRWHSTATKKSGKDEYSFRPLRPGPP